MAPSYYATPHLTPANGGKYRGNMIAVTINGGISIEPLSWLVQQNQTAATQLHCYEIIWLKAGSGTMIADLADWNLSDYTVHILRPGQFRKIMIDDYCEGFCIHVTREFLEQHEMHGMEQFLRANPAISITGELLAETEEILLKLRREYMTHATVRQPILKRFFELFLLYLAEQPVAESVTTTVSSEQVLAEKFLQAVRAEFRVRKMVADYAAILWVTPGHLNRTVKHVTGFPASYHIQQQIILEAKRKARYSEMSMKEIAYDLGFEDASHFSKFFRNNSGVNFTDFRRQVLKDQLICQEAMV
ncbi:AraC-type DNA-binding protein [Chitinophaga jiangningensis]|uniref:AraC-type DNA-binding protein n=1 Tax=Chitinophaga jiangningensis TaxID=1419482 RepID=A0A1M6Z192_9BACT|nr:helix-turn-helix domain-containing protein [Chitinophaga jiangningensis]SHL24160.1 AraC-type DNA-binding protein [Chitinophaga jiangningensis]